MTNYNWTTADPTELLVVADLKRYLRIRHNSEDEDLRRWIEAARVAVESYTGMLIGDRAVTFYRSHFPAGRLPMSLPMSPANSVTSINYIDTAEDSQSYTTFTLRNTHIPEVLPDEGTEWPGVSSYHNDAVTVVYDAGYTAGACPGGMKAAMLHYAASCYEYRGETAAAESSFFSLLAPYVAGDEFVEY